MSWRLDDTRLPDLAATEHNGNRFLSGNGRIGLRGTLDEASAADKAAIIINGFYDRVGELWREPVNAPNGCHLSVRPAGDAATAARFDTRQRVPLSHGQGLDYRHGIQERTTVFSLGEAAEVGGRLTIASRRFVSATEPGLIAIQYEVASDRAVDIIIRSGIDGEVWDLNGPHLEEFSGRAENDWLALDCRSQEAKSPLRVECLTRYASAAGLGPIQVVRDAHSIWQDRLIRLEAGQCLGLEKFVRLSWTDAPAEAAGQPPLRDLAFATLEARHRQVWQERWERCEVRIEGDDEAQSALRFSMYHLLAIAPFNTDLPLSIPARGLSGQVYKGGIFWDTELFMLPFFLSGFPEVARTLLAYRVATLDGARRKAAEYGHTGAFYAWESQESGDDACTCFNVNDVLTGRPMRTFFRDKQIHISADVAWAMGRYAALTGDLGLIVAGGLEVAWECVRFLADWMYWHERRQRWELLDVTGPDEYHERVANDYYTNWISRQALLACKELDTLVAAADPAAHLRIKDLLEARGKLPDIDGLIAGLYLPPPDSASQVIPQFDDYPRLEDASVATVTGRKLHPNEYLGGGNGPARWTTVIKQADVVLALALEGPAAGGELLQANFDYYEPRTEHGSSLSACAYALVAARLGLQEKAYAYFRKTATIDITGDSKHYVGDLYIGGTHPAANGGAWLTAVQGFFGLHATGDGLSLDPRLPVNWRSVEFPLAWRGRRFRLAINRQAVVLSPLQPADGAGGPNGESLLVSCGGKAYSWDPQKSLEISLEN